MHSKNTKNFKIFLYETFSCFINSKNKKDFKFFYIHMLVVLSSVKIQMISSFSSFFQVKISIILTSVKRKRISRFFWIKNLVILSSIKIKRFKSFFYIQILVVLSSAEISGPPKKLPSPLHFVSQNFHRNRSIYMAKIGFFSTPSPSKCRFFQIQNTYTTPKLSAICFNFCSEYVHSAKNFKFSDVYPLPLTSIFFCT